MFKQQKARTKHKFIVSPEELVGIPTQYKRVKLTIAHKSARKTYATQEVAVVPGAEGAPATAVFSSGDRKPLSFTAHLTRAGDGTIDAPVSWAPKFVELTLQGSTQEAGGTGVFAPWRNWEPIAVCDVDLTPFASSASALPPGKYQSTLLPLPWPSSSGVYQQAKIYARSGLLLSIHNSAPPSPGPRTPTSTPASARGPNKQGDIELASASAAQTAYAGVSLPPSLAPSVNGSRRASMEHASAASSVTGATSDEEDEQVGGQQLPYVRAASSGEAASGLREPHATPYDSGILKDSNAASGMAATADSSNHTPSPETSGHSRSNFLSQVIRALSPSPTPSRELRHSLDLQVQQSPSQQQQQQQGPADVRRSLDLQPQAQSVDTRRSFDLEPQPRHFMAPAPSMEPGQSLFGSDVPVHALSDTGFSSSGSGHVSSGLVTSGPTFTTEELRARLVAAAAQGRSAEEDEHAGGFDVQPCGLAGSGLALQQEVAGVAKLSPSASASSSSTEGSALGRGVVGGSASNLAGIAEVDEAAERSSAEYSQRASAEFAAPSAAAGAAPDGAAEAAEVPPAAGPLAAAGAAVSAAASNLQSVAAPAAAAVSAAAGKAVAAVGPMAAAAGTAVSSAADKALTAAGPMASSVASAAGPAAAMIVAAPMAAGVAVVGAAAAATGLAAAALADSAAGVGSEVTKPTTALSATEAATATPISEVQAVEDTAPLVETDSRPFAVPETHSTHAATHAAAVPDMGDAAAATDAAPGVAVLAAPGAAVLAAPEVAVLAAPEVAVLAAPADAALAAPVPAAGSSEIEPATEPAAAADQGLAAPAAPQVPKAEVADGAAASEAFDAPASIRAVAPIAGAAAARNTFRAPADDTSSSVPPAAVASTAAPAASDSSTPAPPSPLKIDSRHDYGRIINRLAPTSKPPPSPKHSPSASPRAEAGAWPPAFAEVGLLPSQLTQQQQQGLMPEEGQQEEQEVQRGKRVLWGEDGEPLQPVTGTQQADAEQLQAALPESIEQEDAPLRQQQQEVQQGSMEELLENAASKQQQEVQHQRQQEEVQQQRQQEEEEGQQGSLDQLLDSELARQQQESVPSELPVADDDQQLLLQQQDQQQQQQQQPQVQTEIEEAEEADANDRHAPTPPMPARQSSDAERSARLRTLADQYNRQLGSSHSGSYSSSFGSASKASAMAAAAKQGAAVALAAQESGMARTEQGRQGSATVIVPLVGAGPAELAGLDGTSSAAGANAAGYAAAGDVAAGYAPGYVAGGAAGYAAVDISNEASGQAALVVSDDQHQLSQGSWSSADADKYSSADIDKLSSKWDQDWEMGVKAAGQVQGPAARLGSSSLYDTAKQYNASLAAPASATGALKGAAAAIADNSTRAAQMLASAVDAATGATSAVAGATYAVAGSVASVAGAGASVGAAGASTALHLGAGAAQGAGHAAIGLGWAAIGVAAWGTATAIHSALSVGRWALGMDKTDGADTRAGGGGEPWEAQEVGRGSSNGPVAGDSDIGDSMWASGDQAGGAQAGGGGAQAGGAQGREQDALPGAASLEYEGSEAVLHNEGQQQLFAAEAPVGGGAARGAAAQGSRSWWWPALPGQQQQQEQQGVLPEEQEQGAVDEEQGVLARAVGALPRPLAVLLQPLLWYVGFVASMVEFGVRVGVWLVWLAFWWLTLPVRVATAVAFAPLRLVAATWSSGMQRVQAGEGGGSSGGLHEGDLGWVRHPGTEGGQERQAFDEPSNGDEVLVGRGRGVVEAGAGGDGEVGRGQQSWLQWAREAAGVGDVYRRIGWAQTHERAV